MLECRCRCRTMKFMCNTCQITISIAIYVLRITKDQRAEKKKRCLTWYLFVLLVFAPSLAFLAQVHARCTRCWTTHRQQKVHWDGIRCAVQYAIAKQPYCFMGDASIKTTHHRIQYRRKFNGTHSGNLNLSGKTKQNKKMISPHTENYLKKKSRHLG